MNQFKRNTKQKKSSVRYLLIITAMFGALAPGLARAESDVARNARIDQQRRFEALQREDDERRRKSSQERGTSTSGALLLGAGFLIITALLGGPSASQKK